MRNMLLKASSFLLLTSLPTINAIATSAREVCDAEALYEGKVEIVFGACLISVGVILMGGAAYYSQSIVNRIRNGEQVRGDDQEYFKIKSLDIFALSTNSMGVLSTIAGVATINSSHCCKIL